MTPKPGDQAVMGYDPETSDPFVLTVERVLYQLDTRIDNIWAVILQGYGPANIFEGSEFWIVR